MGRADWYRDPTGAFEKRYWDGAAWTDHVFHAGTQATAPMTDPGSLPPPHDLGSPSPPPTSSWASAGVPMASPAAPGAVDDRCLWAIVAVPVLVGLIEMACWVQPEPVDNADHRRDRREHRPGAS